MDTLIEQYRDLLEEYYDIYSEQLLEHIPVISTATYVYTILAICIPPIIALIFYEKEQARLRAEQPKGCRKLGLKIESNLLNEFDKKFSEGRPPSTEETSAEWWRLKSKSNPSHLLCFPILQHLWYSCTRDTSPSHIAARTL